MKFEYFMKNLHDSNELKFKDIFIVTKINYQNKNRLLKEKVIIY